MSVSRINMSLLQEISDALRASNDMLYIQERNLRISVNNTEADHIYLMRMNNNQLRDEVQSAITDPVVIVENDMVGGYVV